MKLIASFFLATLLSVAATAQEIPILSRDGLNSIEANYYAKLNGETYVTKNWLNPVRHNIFMANNRSETIQFRVALNNFAERSNGRLRIVDLLEDEALDWKKLSTDEFHTKVQEHHALVAIETSQLINPNAPIILMFSSASHNLLSAVAMSVPYDLARAGFVPVAMEYPGYGASMGTPCKENWQKAAEGTVKFLKKTFPGRSIYLYGHSIGGAVALETAAKVPSLVKGVVTHATFFNLAEAAKDSSKFLLSDYIAPIVATLLANKENWDASENLPVLAEHSIPILFMHGENDRSVSVRHLGLLAAESKLLNQRYPAFRTVATTSDSSHEDMNASDVYGPYSKLWQIANDFIRFSEVSTKKP